MPEITQFLASGADLALYAPAGYAARLMLMGSNWTKINLGVRLRRHRYVSAAEIAGHRFYIGLCNGVASPVGVAAPAHFVGVRSGKTTWSVSGSSLITGWEIVSVESGVTTVQEGDTATATDGCIPDVLGSNGRSRPWYLQFEKLSGGAQIKVTVFMPTGDPSVSPSEAEFLTQMDNTVFSSAVSNHGSYISVDDTFALDQGTHGVLNAVNIMTTLTDNASTFGSMRWGSVKVKRHS